MEITKNRTLRPSSRDPKSPYKVNTENVTENDVLIVNIDHESKSDFHKTYVFKGSDVAMRNSIHFDAYETATGIKIEWKGSVSPIKEI
ncbi:MAG TPA: hypothetical protein PLN63_07065 [Paludibacteraceae bacterium]|jgi:hypothetical protein|nr:hypothetical protein [Paludibacteraceae bacterium]HOU68602.1 hypothetical protein [Paludibacteraceae bacterium]HPH63362.1 hypothetical protein [Paludibacteraceae bacterium]